MGEFDPFEGGKKVGNIYGPDGSKIGYIRDPSQPTSIATAFGCIVLVCFIVGGIVFAIGNFFSSVSNWFEHGQFQASGASAEFDANLDNEQYFTQLAADARITVGEISDFGFPSGTGSRERAYVVVPIQNASDETHSVTLERIVIRVRTQDTGRDETRSVVAMCPQHRVFPPLNDAPPQIAPHSTKLVRFEACMPGTQQGEFLGEPTPRTPAILAIDGYPLSGSPASAGILEPILTPRIPDYCNVAGVYQQNTACILE